MKEVKAFIHRIRAADVLRKLRSAGFDRISVVDVKGMLAALDPKEREYSLELGTETVTAIKIELVCDEERVEEAIRILCESARTGQRAAGWVQVQTLDRFHSIDEGAPDGSG